MKTEIVLVVAVLAIAYGVHAAARWHARREQRRRTAEMIRSVLEGRAEQ
jgi:hypothetical protein